MYVCMCACVNACVNACVHTFVYMRVHVSVSVCMRAHSHACVLHGWKEKIIIHMVNVGRRKSQWSA